MKACRRERICGDCDGGDDCVGGGVALRAQQGAPPAKNPFAAADEKILAEVHDHNEIMSNLEYLSDMIGQRLTGSENLKKANEWTKQKFTDYGLGIRTWNRGRLRISGRAERRRRGF